MLNPMGQWASYRPMGSNEFPGRKSHRQTKDPARLAFTMCSCLCQACCPVPNYPGNTGSCLRHLQALQNLQREQLAEQKLLWMCQSEFRDLTFAEWMCCQVFCGVPRLTLTYTASICDLMMFQPNQALKIWPCATLWCDPHMWQFFAWKHVYSKAPGSPNDWGGHQHALQYCSSCVSLYLHVGSSKCASWTCTKSSHIQLSTGLERCALWKFGLLWTLG